jgi:hypothetical protein
MLPKKGKVLPSGSGPDRGGTHYAEIIAIALRAELGASHRAIKTVMRWTGASERTAKNWFGGDIGPNGQYLIRLLRESNAVLETVLAASGRAEALGFFYRSIAMNAHRMERSTPSASSSEASDQIGRFRLDDPIHDPDRDPVDPKMLRNLNARQRWFLAELARNQRARAENIEVRHDVSSKTAKRDIAGLKAAGLIEFVGSRRTGRYRIR